MFSFWMLFLSVNTCVQKQWMVGNVRIPLQLIFINNSKNSWNHLNGCAFSKQTVEAGAMSVASWKSKDFPVHSPQSCSDNSSTPAGDMHRCHFFLLTQCSPNLWLEIILSEWSAGDQSCEELRPNPGHCWTVSYKIYNYFSHSKDFITSKLSNNDTKSSIQLAWAYVG